MQLASTCKKLSFPFLCRCELILRKRKLGQEQKQFERSAVSFLAVITKAKMHNTVLTPLSFTNELGYSVHEVSIHMRKDNFLGLSKLPAHLVEEKSLSGKVAVQRPLIHFS